MEEPTYWTRFWRRRLSRRRLLTGAALTGSGVAAAAVVGCGGDDSSSSSGERGRRQRGLGEKTSAPKRSSMRAGRWSPRRRICAEARSAPRGSTRWCWTGTTHIRRSSGRCTRTSQSVFSKLYMYAQPLRADLGEHRPGPGGECAGDDRRPERPDRVRGEAAQGREVPQHGRHPRPLPDPGRAGADRRMMWCTATSGKRTRRTASRRATSTAAASTRRSTLS